MDLRDLVLTTRRLTLAAFRPADAAEIFAAVTPSVTRYMSFDPEPSLDAFAAVWRPWLARMAAGEELLLVVRAAESGEFLGAAGLHRIGAAEPTAGLWLKEGARGQGYGPEAVATLIAWAADRRGARGAVAGGRGEPKKPPAGRGSGRHRRRHRAAAQGRNRASRGHLPHPGTPGRGNRRLRGPAMLKKWRLGLDGVGGRPYYPRTLTGGWR